MIIKHRAAVLAAGAVAALLAACGSSSTSSSGAAGAGGGFGVIQSAFSNYGNQPSAHMKIGQGGGSSSTPPTSFDVDVTKDGMTGTATLAGQQYGVVYTGGHGYVQTAAGAPYTQLTDAEAKGFGFFTISKFSTCFNSLLTSKAPQLATSVTSSATTVNGTAATDYKSPDGQAEIIVSSGANPLPIRIAIQGGGSSSSSSSSLPGCDLGSSSSTSTSSDTGSIQIDWTYPGSVTTITPPATAATST